MKEFQNKRVWRRIGYPPLTIVGLAVLIGLLTGTVWRLYQKNRLIADDRRSLLEEVERLKNRQAKLSNEVGKLATERGVEEAIRENFNVVKPGEMVIHLLPPATTAPPLAPPPAWWQKFISWLGL